MNFVRFIALCFGCLIFVANARADESLSKFKADVEPIFQSHCVSCHGAEEQESQFRIDRRHTLIQGGNSGEPAVVPGNPDDSYLLKLIRHEESGMEMPPDGKLSQAEINKIEKWIQSGAPTTKSYGGDNETKELTHWSFQPIVRPKNGGSVDDFVSARLRQDGLRLSKRAQRRTLIRRLFLVMHGLPPSPEQVERFVDDGSDDAWGRLVESVLESPRYGERWASHWLDLVRFGETTGFETNRERPNAWRYRDWVIDALNTDKPYDEFVRQQIAGDAFGEDVATGFLVAGPNDIVKGQDPKLNLIQRMNELDDMINTTGTAFLGLTTGCARCHNHKFDPITQRDYYSLQAVFAGVAHGDRALSPNQKTKDRLKAIDGEIARLKNLLVPFRRKPSYAAVVIDDSDADKLVEPSGTAKTVNSKPTAFDRQGYTWWKNTPGQFVAAYRPRVRGKYRIWISWGAGVHTHSADARYILKSVSGETAIATVNQQHDADGGDDKGLRWSGWHDAGVFELTPSDEVLVAGGDQGTAVTADVIVFQPVATPDNEKATAQPPNSRPVVNAKLNEERFAERVAKFVRFSIEDTTVSNACIDELEIYSGDRNVALASEDARATSSGDFVHPLHKLEHINDGLVGNSKSWIVSTRSDGWIQIEFALPQLIDRIYWSRDRTEKYKDRVATKYRIESALEPDQWETIAESSDRANVADSSDQWTYTFSNVPKNKAEQARQWLETLDELKNEQSKLAKAAMAYAGNFSQPGPTHRLYRGEPDARREPVNPGGIEAFKPWTLDANAPEQERRKILTDWITDSKNPLTARVIVNRIWQFHFGTGIVDTPSDFGINGTQPTHPELLDWLACELRENNWSLKHVHRLILNSKTWQQSNQPIEAAVKIDAQTRLLWRFPPRRLAAEAIRDSILATSGVLDVETMGGPGFSAFAVHMENVRHYHPKDDYGPKDWRRMIYMTKVRQEKDQVFGVFDCPDASMVVAKRSRSTTPLQALNLLNSGFVMQQSELLAKRLAEHDEKIVDQIRYAWQLCLQRQPGDAETSESTAFIEKHGTVQFCRALLNANEFVFIP